MTRHARSEALGVLVLVGCLAVGGAGGFALGRTTAPQPATVEVSSASPECVQAMRRQYVEARATGAQGSRPDECEGVSAAALEAVVGDIVADDLARQMGNG